MAKKRNRLLRVLLLFAVLGGLAAIGYFTGLTKDLSAEKIRVVVQDAGPWGVLLYLALFAIGTAMQAPGMLFVAAAILAYGKTTGFFIAHAGAVLSVSVNYALGRSVGGDALDTFKERMKFRWIRALFEQLDTHPLRTVLVLRLIFWLAPPLNYALALYGVRYRDYVIGSIFGLIAPIAVATLLFDWMFT